MKRILSALPLGAALLLFALPVAAADPYLGLEYARGIGLPTIDIRDWVASIIRSFMALLGLILVMQIMWGGFLMMTHGGSEERREKAIGTLKDAVVGMVIIMSSASAARFVVDAVMNAAKVY
jgi:hypothetical protein